MFRRIKPDDIRITPFTSHKDFSFTHNSSGSGVYVLKAVSSSTWNYVSQSDSVSFAITSSPVVLNTFIKSRHIFGHVTDTIIHFLIELSVLLIILAVVMFTLI